MANLDPQRVVDHPVDARVAAAFLQEIRDAWRQLDQHDEWEVLGKLPLSDDLLYFLRPLRRTSA